MEIEEFQGGWGEKALLSFRFDRRFSPTRAIITIGAWFSILGSRNYPNA